MEAFICGGPNPSFNAKFIRKLNDCGFVINMVGEALASANPQNVTIPDSASSLVVIRDICSHKLRDKCVAEAKKRDLKVWEVPSKVSYAYSILLKLGDLAAVATAAIRLNDPSTQEEECIAMTEYLPLWLVAPFDLQSSGSIRALHKYWRRFSDLSAAETKEFHRTLKNLPAQGKREKINLWLQHGVDTGFVFPSKPSLDRAIQMTFGVKSGSRLIGETLLDEALGIVEEEIEESVVIVEEPTPVIVEEPTPVLIEEPTPVIIEEPTPVTVAVEPEAELPLAEKCLIINGTDLTELFAGGASLTLGELNINTTICRGYSITAESINNGILTGVVITEENTNNG